MSTIEEQLARYSDAQIAAIVRGARSIREERKPLPKKELGALRAKAKALGLAETFTVPFTLRGKLKIEAYPSDDLEPGIYTDVGVSLTKKECDIPLTREGLRLLGDSLYDLFNHADISQSFKAVEALGKQRDRDIDRFYEAIDRLSAKTGWSSSEIEREVRFASK